MEDQLFVHIRHLSWSGVGVFDGHAGKKAAVLAKSRLGPRILRKLEEFKITGKEQDKKQVETIIREECSILQEEMRRKRVRSGTTAIMMFYHPSLDYLFVFWIGDSRLIVTGKDGKVEFATRDHKPSDKNESERITKTGGTIEDDDGIMRVNGYLSLSRAFGDFEPWYALHDNEKGEYDPEHTPLIAVPEFEAVPITGQSSVLLACDGLWDVFNNDEIAKSIYNSKQCDQILLDLTHQAIHERKSEDNVSLILLRLSKSAKANKSKATEEITSLLAKLKIDRNKRVHSRKTTRRTRKKKTSF